MLTAAEYTKARETYQARLAAAVAAMVGILNPIEPPESEPEVNNRTQTKYHVSRDVTYMEVVDVVADSMAAAIRMVEAGVAKPRMIKSGATRWSAHEATK